MKKIKYLFFIFIFFISISSVNAEETKTGIGYLNNSTVIISDNRGNDIQLSRLTSNSQNITIRNILFQSTYNFEKDVVYEYEIELANQYIDNISSIFLRGGNTICSFISLQGLNSSYLKVRFTCPSNVSYVTIGLSNLGDSAITNGYNIQWKNIYLWQINDAIDLGPIINGQNQNTQDIINNQNSNTDKEIESQKVCNDKIIDINDTIATGYFNSNGELLSSVYDKVTDYISISSDDVLTGLTGYQWSYSCFYDNLKVKVSCFSNNFTSNTNITIPSNASYVRFSINNYNNQNIPRFNLHRCINGNQALNDSVNNLDGTLKDDSVDENGVADAFNDFNDFLDDNSTITQLITLPITLYTAILNNLNGSCSPFNLGKLYGEDLILPCINISQYLGNSLWTMIDIIISGFAVYAISKKMIKVFNNFSSLREGDVIDD